MFTIAKFEKATNRKSIKKEFLSGYETREEALDGIKKIENRLYMQHMQKYGLVSSAETTEDENTFLYVVKTVLMFDPDYYYKFYILETA